MRKEPLPILDKMRINDCNFPYLSDYIIQNKGNIGIFEFREKKTGKLFFIISSITQGWEHVSVSIRTKGKKGKMPSWNDMCKIKDLFFDPEEIVVQIHPKRSEYVNIHEGVLHLWKKVHQEWEHPPINLL